MRAVTLLLTWLQDKAKLLDFNYVDQDVLSLRKQMKLHPDSLDTESSKHLELRIYTVLNQPQKDPRVNAQVQTPSTIRMMCHWPNADEQHHHQTQSQQCPAKKTTTNH